MIIVKITRFLNKITSEIASWFVFLMMILAVVDVVGRYVFKSSIFGSQDLTQLMMVIVVFLGFGIEAEEDKNVRIEILYQYFGKKLKAVMSLGLYSNLQSFSSSPLSAVSRNSSFCLLLLNLIMPEGYSLPQPVWDFVYSLKNSCKAALISYIAISSR